MIKIVKSRHLRKVYTQKIAFIIDKTNIVIVVISVKGLLFLKI